MAPETLHHYRSPESNIWFIPGATVEEVVRLTIALTNQGTRIYECRATFESANKMHG